MDKFKEIRPIVLGVVKNNNKTLVTRGYDNVTGETFYRSIGGGIEFLEHSKDALKREFKEEINVDVKVEKFLGVCENIFTYEGKAGHELILFYNANIEEKDIKEEYHVVDDGCETDAVWIEIEKLKKGELKIYPEQILKYLD